MSFVFIRWALPFADFTRLDINQKSPLLVASALVGDEGLEPPTSSV